MRAEESSGHTSADAVRAPFYTFRLRRGKGFAGRARALPAMAGRVSAGHDRLGLFPAELRQSLEHVERVADVVEGGGDLHTLNRAADFEQEFAGDLQALFAPDRKSTRLNS